MNRLIVIIGAVVIILCHLPYGIGYMQTVKKHREDAKKEITTVEFAGEIVNIKKDFIYIKLEAPLFDKILPIEYPYQYDDTTCVLPMLVNKSVLRYAKIGMGISKMRGADSIFADKHGGAIRNRRRSFDFLVIRHIKKK